MPATLSYDERTRDLPDQRVPQLPCDESDYDGFRPFPVEGGTLSIELTIDEFTKLISSVMVGASLIYPDDTDYLYWLIVQSVGCNQIDVCDENEDVILVVTIQEIVDAVCACDSIQTIQQVVVEQQQQQAIEAFENREDTHIQPPPPEVWDKQIKTISADEFGEFDCSNDNAYAMAIAITDQLEEEVQNLFDARDAANNTAELVNDFIDNAFWAPELNDAISDLIDSVSSIVDYGETAFNASFTATYRDELECALFEKIVCNDCSISIKDISDIFEDRIGFEQGQSVWDDLGDLVQVADDLVAGSSAFVANATYALMFRNAQSGNFGNVELGFTRRITRAIQAARDETNNNWNVNCDTPQCPWEYVWNKGDDTAPILQYFVDNVATATHTNTSTSLMFEHNNELQATAYVLAITGTPIIQSSTVKVQLTLGNPGPSFNLLGFNLEGETNGALARQYGNVNKKDTFVRTADTAAQSGNVQVGFDQINFNGTGTVDILEWTFKGTGVNPFAGA